MILRRKTRRIVGIGQIHCGFVGFYPMFEE